MKKLILLAITTLVMSFCLKAQEVTIYPYLQKNPKSGATEVVFNLTQANTINNALDILSQTDSLIRKYEVKDSISILIVDKNKNLISKMDLIISTLSLKVANRDSAILELNKLISNYEKSNALCENELTETKKELKKQKFLAKVGFVTSSILLITTITLIMVK